MSKIEILDQKVLDNRKVILQRVNDNGFEHSRIILPHLTDDELLVRYKRIKPIKTKSDSTDDLHLYLGINTDTEIITNKKITLLWLFIAYKNL